MADVLDRIGIAIGGNLKESVVLVADPVVTF